MEAATVPTRLSRVNGQIGELIIAGFPLEEIASHSTFEETLYLLWHDSLPTAEQLEHLKKMLVAQRPLPAATLDILKEAALHKVGAMDALRMAASTLTLKLPQDSREEDLRPGAIVLVACLPTIVATYWRLLHNQAPIEPNSDLDHTANYLYMLFGEVPSPENVRALETYFNTVSDHGLNASTLTARVITSTQSDVISAVVGAIGALKGPLHGGAPGLALDMVLEIGDPSQAESYLRNKLESGGRLMGFGHRVYKVRDPRASMLSKAAENMCRAKGDMKLYNLARQVEEVAVKLLGEYKPGRKLETNVEYYTALILHELGLSKDFFTPTFAVGRVSGWTAHCFEQQSRHRLIRPLSPYVGATDRHWVPLEKR